MINYGIEESSFRDPSGFVYQVDNLIYRQVNQVYKDNYDILLGSGLYQALVDNELLIPHEEIALDLAVTDQAYKVIKPEKVNFLSYPYEWSFSQLKDAALVTLKIQQIALEYGMSLKDASAYNIQFYKGKPVFIDTLSFEKYPEGQPWIAYKQFCQHFLAPLTLMAYRDIRLNQFSKVYIDGVPLDLASSLLPFRTHFNFALLSHLHLHAKSQQYYAEKPVNAKKRNVSKIGVLAIIDSLQSTIKKLRWQPSGTEWADYYENNNNYTSGASGTKKNQVAQFLEKIKPQTVWDLGANTGVYSRVASSLGIQTISLDIDPSAVEKNYLKMKEDKETNILPLLQDLTNPTSSIGWNNEERLAFLKRGPVDAVLALALIHHLAISNNVPLTKIASFFKGICKWLIIEFVPKSDSQVQKLLTTREDIFPEYTVIGFEKAFTECFDVIDSKKIDESERRMYLMKVKLS